MNVIDPKMPVSEILSLYPETVDVFRSFGMKCAYNSEYAALSLEENFLTEQVNFMDLLRQLNKSIHPKKEESRIESSPAKKINAAKKIIVSVKNTQIEVETPSEIGNVISQHTSIGEKFSLMKFINMGLWGCFGFMGFMVLMAMLSFSFMAINAIIIALFAGAFAAFYFKRETVGIIGSQGFVVYKISKQTQLVVSRKVYLFKNVAELVFPQTTHYMNYSYNGTSFKFRLQTNENVIYEQSGRYYNEKGEAGKYGWKFPFLCDIENAGLCGIQIGSAFYTKTNRNRVELF